MQGGKGVEAFDVSTFAHTSYPGSVAVTVLLVYLLHRGVTDRFLGFADTAGSFDPGDLFVQVRTGEPEPGRHAPGRLVLDNARESEWTPGGDLKVSRLAS
jgi:hypothetical protein